MLTRLVWQLASVFVAQLDQEVALYSHNSGIKAQRIKCCVTLGQRNSVIMRACARLLRACVRVLVCSVFCVYSVSVGSGSLTVLMLLQQDENKEVRVCLKQKRESAGDTEREGEQVREILD